MDQRKDSETKGRADNQRADRGAHAGHWQVRRTAYHLMYAPWYAGQLFWLTPAEPKCCVRKKPAHPIRTVALKKQHPSTQSDQ